MQEIQISKYWDFDHTAMIVRKYEGFLAQGVISADDLAEKILSDLVCAPDDTEMRRGIELIPDLLLPSFFDYLERRIKPLDFKPSPSFFLTPPYSAEDSEAAKIKLRPRYVRLYELLEENLKDRR